MFSYYGCKNRLSKLYPIPIYDVIIEPFAGAAFYSCRNGLYKNVILYDLYKPVCDIWNWLIHAKPEQVISLPEPKKGERVRDLNVTEAEKHLIYFMSSRANSMSLNTVGSWSSYKSTKKRILSCLDGIRNWKINMDTYENCPNLEATWFIDPPYFKGGHRYTYSNKRINYPKLGEWCKSRRGQVIVCENSSASWLPFRNLAHLNGQKHKTQEVIWTN